MSLSTVFVKINTVPKYIYRGKSGTKIWATSVIFKKKTAQRQQSPNGRKFAQSGHSDFRRQCPTRNEANKASEHQYVTNNQVACKHFLFILLYIQF
jgi:hypothetical protein